MSLLDKASLIVTPNGYSEDTLYSVVPSSGAGDLSFARATDAWRTNSQGLIERTPWNLYTQSNGLTGWSVLAVTTSNSVALSPSGLLNASSIYETSATTTHITFRDATTIANQDYTYSGYFKSINGRNVAIAMSSGVGLNAIVSLSTGQVLSGTLPVTITPLPNGWYRISGTLTGTTTTMRVIIYTVDGTSLTFAGDTTKGIYNYGNQLVEGSSALEYFPTTDRLNVPRIDYSLGGCPNILLEPQRTNLALQSSSFDSATWAKLGATLPIVTANTAISPSGIMDADSVKFANIASAAIVYQSLSHTSGQQITVSVYAKRNAATDQVFRLFGDMGSSISSIFTATSEWQRFTYTFTASATGSRSMGIYNVSNFASDIQIWGYQFEVGAYATSYIPTTSASVTRNADSITRNNIFTNGLITAAGGTWFVELRNNIPIIRDSIEAGIYIDSSSVGFTNGFNIRNALSSSVRVSISKWIAGAGTSLYTTTANNVKIAIKWNGTTADIFENGVKVISATSFAITNMEFLYALGNVSARKYIASSILFPTPLSDAECIALTT